MLERLLSEDIFALALVFARLGATLMLMPGFGEVYVSARIRLVFALALTLIVTPLVAQTLPALPPGPFELLLVIGSEILIGLFIGALARFLVSALHVAGVVISYQGGLSAAQFFDPSAGQQGSVVAAFYNVVGIFLIFAADLHHLMLMALVRSYELFVPGAPIPTGDFSEVGTRMVADSFALGIQIAAPVIVVGLVFYVGLGLLNRLMPQVQVFFVTMPLQIGLTFLVVALTLGTAMMWFLDGFQAHWMRFLGQG